MTFMNWIDGARNGFQQACLRRRLARAGQAGRLFFVFGCPRSGTTSLCRILDRAENATCLLEPDPNLTIQCRQRFDGRLHDPAAALWTALAPRIERGLAEHAIYGEKNNTLAAFIPELQGLLHGKLLWVTRDGRETVASMHNWHREMFGNFYRECLDAEELSDRARAVLAQLPLEADASNYSRPRPGPQDPYYPRWPTMSRHEMLCWYWSFITQYTLDRLQAIPASRWRRVDYSAADLAEQVRAAVDFLGLRAVAAETIAPMLRSRVNSVADRTGTAQRLPTWHDWSSQEQEQFWTIAGGAMTRLGYAPATAHRRAKDNNRRVTVG